MVKRNKTPEEIVDIIRNACAELGWFIGLDESDTHVSGLVIGQNAYVESVLEQLDDMDNYSIFEAATPDTELQ